MTYTNFQFRPNFDEYTHICELNISPAIPLPRSLQQYVNYHVQVLADRIFRETDRISLADSRNTYNYSTTAKGNLFESVA